MALHLAKKWVERDADGNGTKAGLFVVGDAPKVHHFSEQHVMRLALEGFAVLEAGTKDVPLLQDSGAGSAQEFTPVLDDDEHEMVQGKDDVVVLRTEEGDVRYRVTARSGDRVTGVFDDLHCKLETRKGA